MHLFEYAMRDFMHIEKYANPQTIVVIDDIFPNHEDQAKRERVTSSWTGDIWKLHQILKRFRPDLILVPIDTSPTGLLLVLGLDSKSKVLWEKYNPIVDTHIPKHPPTDGVIQRHGAISPNGEIFSEILDLVEEARQLNVPIRRHRPKIKNLLS